MTKNMTLRYIPSAFESAGSFLTVHGCYPKLAEEMIQDLQTQEPDIDVGVLWNAYSEKKDGIEFNKVLRPLGVKQYADSGGLQVISVGAEITTEIKNEIFHTQMENCDYAMSFDEIPITFSENGPDGGSYVDEWFKKKAIESGQNIVDQIRVFKKNKTQAKILFIVQGKTFETCREWAWFMHEVIKHEPDYEQYIGGLALGKSGAGGIRNITDFTLRFQTELEFLPKEWVKKLHILGAGAVSRLMGPIFVNDNLFVSGTTITADSTTQTRGPIFGNFQAFNEKTGLLENHAPGRGDGPKADFVCDHQAEYALPYLKKYQSEYNLQVTTKEDFREHYTEYASHGLRIKKDFQKKYPDDEETANYEYKKHSRMARYFWTMSMVSDFLKFIESLKVRADKYRSSNEYEQLEIVKDLKVALVQKLYKPAKLLMEINTHGDYVSQDELIQGHPYKTILPLVLQKDVIDSIVTYQGRKYITDFYNGELLGRPLQSNRAGCEELIPNTKRKVIMSMLGGTQLDTITTEQNQNLAIDEW